MAIVNSTLLIRKGEILTAAGMIKAALFAKDDVVADVGMESNLLKQIG